MEDPLTALGVVTGGRSSPANAFPDVGSLTNLETRVKEINWYHTLDLGGGVRTHGVFDHRAILDDYPVPSRLDGLRVLDVATFDGYWAFEMERRGASEVVALDVSCARELDLPRKQRTAMTDAQLDAPFGRGFSLAHEAYGSKVKRIEMSVYDLSAKQLGTFDLVHTGSLLLHLKNPVLALERIREVSGGQAVFTDCYNRKLPFNLMRYLGGGDNCAWWGMSLACLTQMIEDAGYERVELKKKFILKHSSTGQRVAHASYLAHC